MTKVVCRKNAIIFSLLFIFSGYALGYEKRYIDMLSEKESLSAREMSDICSAMENGWEGSFHGQCSSEQWVKIKARVAEENLDEQETETALRNAKVESSVSRLNPKKYSYPSFDAILHNDFFANQQTDGGVIFISSSSPSILLVKKSKFGMAIQYPRAAYREHLKLVRRSMLVEYFPYLRCELKQRSGKNLFGENKSYSVCEEIDSFESEAAELYIEYPEQ